MSVNLTKQGIFNASGNINPNLILGTNIGQYSGNSTGARARGMLGVGSGGNGTFSIVEDNTVPVGNYSYNVLDNTTGNRDYQQDMVPYVSGKKYTASWWAKGNGTCLSRSWDLNTSTQLVAATYTLTSDWKYYCRTFTATQAMEDDNCTYQLGLTGAGNIYICGMKVEEGEIATPWTPAPEDDIYVGNICGFTELTNISGNTKSRISQEYIESIDFVEW